MSMWDNNTKYDGNNQFDIDRISTMLDEAIKYCDYVYDEAKVTQDNIFKLYGIKDKDNDMIATISLTQSDGIFYIIVSTTYYMHIIKPVDVNYLFIAYILRNATKMVDDYDESIQFFGKFFSRMQDEVSSDNQFASYIEHAFEEEIMPSYIYPSSYKNFKNNKKLSQA